MCPATGTDATAREDASKGRLSLEVIRHHDCDCGFARIEYTIASLLMIKGDEEGEASWLLYVTRGTMQPFASANASAGASDAVGVIAHPCR